MAINITEVYVNNFVDRIQKRLEELDADLQDIAASSQRDYRSNLSAGQVVPGYRPTTVVTDAGKTQAEIATDRARRDIEAMFDKLDRDAVSGRAESASADDVATVTLALSLDPDEKTLRDLYEVYGRNATLRKAIRQAATKAHVKLPMTVADVVADNREDARAYAIRCVLNRYTPGGMVELTVMPSARIDAQSIEQHLLGVDVFGRPLG